MAEWGLKLVPAAWELSMPLPFSEAEYSRYGTEIVPGMRIFVMREAPVNAIVCEAESKGTFIHVRDWAASGVHVGDVFGADYLLPVGIMYQRSGAALIPMDEVRTALRADHPFPMPGETFFVLRQDEYQGLIAGWA